MACILLVDGAEVAQMAMKGIVARAGHRFACCKSVAEAWEFIRRNVRVDVVFTGIKVDGGGVVLVERLKQDCFLKTLPVVVYTDAPEREKVKRLLQLGVQNVLVKPYHDDVIYTEITKATTDPWRAKNFEEEKSFCKMMGYTPERLHQMLQALEAELAQGKIAFQENVRSHATKDALDRLDVLNEHAEAAGAWGVVELIGQLRDRVGHSAWADLEQMLPQLDLAEQLIIQQLNPAMMSPEFLSSEEQHGEEEAREHARWFGALSENRCPVTDWMKVQQELDSLPGCPVIDSVVASFRMSATGHPSSLRPLMDLVGRDPGLAAQILIAVNHLKHADGIDAGQVVDPQLAIGLLGEQRLATVARTLVPAPERLMQVLPSFNWPNYWMFQIGVARVAKFTCGYLGLHSLESAAYYAGLMHDLGKLLLLRLHPFALQAALDHVRRNGGTMREVERRLLGCTTREMAVHFAERNGLPSEYVNVLRWIDDPEQAGAHAELTAVVSLAHDLCLHNHVGFCGDTAKDQAPPLSETAEWRVLRQSVFPSFNLRQFETQVHADCRELKMELHGRLQKYAVA